MSCTFHLYGLHELSPPKSKEDQSACLVYAPFQAWSRAPRAVPDRRPGQKALLSCYCLAGQERGA